MTTTQAPDERIAKNNEVIQEIVTAIGTLQVNPDIFAPRNNINDQETEIVRSILTSMLKHNVNIAEVGFILQLVESAQKTLVSQAMQSIKESVRKFYEKKIGKTEDELTFSDLDETLKEEQAKL